jgi:hypothetical protein
MRKKTKFTSVDLCSFLDGAQQRVVSYPTDPVYGTFQLFRLNTLRETTTVYEGE